MRVNLLHQIHVVGIVGGGAFLFLGRELDTVRPGSALLNPQLQVGDVLFWKRTAALLRRHEVVIVRLQSGQCVDCALFGVEGNNVRGVFARLEGLFAGGDDPVALGLVLVVAGHAVLFKDRLNVLLKADSRSLLQHHAGGPFGPLLDPGLDDFDLALFQDAFLFWRHDHVVFHVQQQRRVDRAGLQITGNEAWPVLIPLFDVFQRVHAEVALVFFGAVTMSAGTFQERFDLRVEVDLFRRVQKRGRQGNEWDESACDGHGAEGLAQSCAPVQCRGHGPSLASGTAALTKLRFIVSCDAFRPMRGTLARDFDSAQAHG